MRIQHASIAQLFSFAAVLTLSAFPPLTEGNQGAEKQPLRIPQPIQDKYNSEVQYLAYSPKLKLLASAPAIYNFKSQPSLPIYLWELQTGKLKKTLPGHRQRIAYLGFTPDGTHLVSGASDGVILWDPVEGTADRERYKSLGNAATLSPSGKELIHWDEEANIVTWDAKTGLKERVMKASKEAKEGIKWADEASCAMSGDERWVALGAGLGNHKIVVWDNKNGTVAAALPHESRLFYLSFSKTGQYLFGGGNEVRKKYLGRGVLDIWDTKTWKLIREIEVDDREVRQVLDFPKDDLVLTVDRLRSPVRANTILFRTFVNCYSIKTGERVVSFDTQLAKDGWCTSALYLEDMDAICIGGADGKISFFSVPEILKHKTKN